MSDVEHSQAWTTNVSPVGDEGTVEVKVERTMAGIWLSFANVVPGNMSFGTAATKIIRDMLATAEAE